MSKKTVAIVGASTNREKFGNKSVRAHLQQGWEVYPINPKGGTIEGLTAYSSITDVPLDHLDRISIYLPPALLLPILPEIASKRCDEFFLNPGSDDEEVVSRAEELGLQPIRACSIVDVGMAPNQLSDA